jgi:hypothetical protein
MKEEWRRKLYVHCSNMKEKNGILLVRLDISKLKEIRVCVWKVGCLLRKEECLCLYICIYTHTHTYIYIYITTTKHKG